jgi:hypothetical protein
MLKRPSNALLASATGGYLVLYCPWRYEETLRHLLASQAQRLLLSNLHYAEQETSSLCRLRSRLAIDLFVKPSMNSVMMCWIDMVSTQVRIQINGQEIALKKTVYMIDWTRKSLSNIILLFLLFLLATSEVIDVLSRNSSLYPYTIRRLKLDAPCQKSVYGTISRL